MSFYKYKQGAANDNSIQLMQNALVSGAAQYGIQHSKMQYNSIYHNYIFGPGFTATAVPNITGINGTTNAGAKITCNDVVRLTYGFSFTNTPNTSTWTGNLMQTNKYGLYLSLTMIGTQGSATVPSDNDWLGIWGGGTFQTYDRDVTSLAYAPSHSFLNVRGGAGFDPTVNTGLPLVPNNIYGVLTGAYANIFVVTAPPAYVECAPQQPGAAYALIYNGIATLNTNVPDNTDSLLNTPDSSIALAAPVDMTTSNWTSQMITFQAMQADTTMPDTSALLNAFEQMGQNSRYGWLTAIEDNLANEQYDKARAQLAQDIDALATTATDPVTGVIMADGTDADAVVSNYINYYNLYLKYVTDTLTAKDTAAIGAIANLCPNLYGAVVHNARSLYNVLTNQYITYIDDCMPPALSERKRHTGPGNNGSNSDDILAGKQSYRLYPNPSHGNINIVQHINDPLPVSAEIVDAIGQTIYKADLMFQGRFIQMHTEVPPGIYVLHLTDSNGKIFILKFTIE